MLFEFDPTRDEHAYFLGLLATDGSITAASRNRGRVTFELGAIDAPVLSALAKVMPYSGSLSSRRRTTNFCQSYESAILRFCDLRLRRQLHDWGYPSGKKSDTVGPPQCEYDESGFWRGVLDGDGSMGVTANDRAFVSLVTASELMRNAYIDFVAKITGAQPNPTRNTRDDVFNIVLFDEKAQWLVNHLYADDLVAIPRKLSAAKSVARWRRPEGRTRIGFERRKWTADQDRRVLSDLSLGAIATELARTVQAVNVRRWRLRASLQKLSPALTTDSTS